MSDGARLEDLEIRIAHLERAVQDLSDVLYRQQGEIDRALARSVELSRQVEALEARADGEPGPPPVEIPPHY